MAARKGLHCSQGRWVGENAALCLSEIAGAGLEGRPRTRVTAQQAPSPLRNKELKVRVRGGGDRRQESPVVQPLAQLLPHTTFPLWLVLQA